MDTDAGGAAAHANGSGGGDAEAAAAQPMEAAGGEEDAGADGGGGGGGGLALDAELTPEEIMMMQQMGMPFVSCCAGRLPYKRACCACLPGSCAAVCQPAPQRNSKGATQWLLHWRLIVSCPCCTPRLQGFDTSQGKQHADAGAVKVKSTREGRQYMNRRVSYLHKSRLHMSLYDSTCRHSVSLGASFCGVLQGGFNRPLEVEATGQKVRIEWLRS
jgi:ribosomal protein L35AE/L33A